jgi:hypothetical protein
MPISPKATALALVMLSAAGTARAQDPKCGATSCMADCCRTPNTTSARGAVTPQSLAAGLEPLVADFNAAKDRPRFVTILSPTCSLCLHGADAIKAAVLPTTPGVEVFVVWSAMLGADDSPAASASARILAAPNVHQYWDPVRGAGSAFRSQVFPDATARMQRSVPAEHFLAKQLAARDPNQAEWDIYMLFETGQQWLQTAPTPRGFVRQVELVDSERSLLWRDDYATVPVEARLADELRKLIAATR